VLKVIKSTEAGRIAMVAEPKSNNVRCENNIIFRKRKNEYMKKKNNELHTNITKASEDIYRHK
jgi:hypothetical protein